LPADAILVRPAARDALNAVPKVSAMWVTARTGKVNTPMLRRVSPPTIEPVQLRKLLRLPLPNARPIAMPNRSV
jgi:hypothetical protein